MHKNCTHIFKFIETIERFSSFQFSPFLFLASLVTFSTYSEHVLITLFSAVHPLLHLYICLLLALKLSSILAHTHTHTMLPYPFSVLLQTTCDCTRFLLVFVASCLLLPAAKSWTAEELKSLRPFDLLCHVLRTPCTPCTIISFHILLHL